MSGKRENAAIVGVAAVACAACCAGPIIGFLAAIGLGTVVGITLSATIGAAIAGIGVIIVLRRRRNRARACSPAASPVVVVTANGPNQELTPSPHVRTSGRERRGRCSRAVVVLLAAMKIIDTGKQRFESASGRATSWVAGQQDDSMVTFATKLYTRDQDAFASVLGSAIALRLFLFFVPANVALLGLINLLRLDSALGSLIESSPTTGQMAQNYKDLSVWHALGITISGLVLTLWAGRSLTRVLATCSAAAWQMRATAAKVRLGGVVALTCLLFALMVSSMLFAQIRQIGPAVAVAVWVAVTCTVLLGWFAVQMVLPRGTTDPGAMLPGAALVGVGFAILQWVMQIYLPGKIARTTDTMGSLAATVATLGYFFLVGRMMSASFVVNAMVFQRWGSISRVVFSVPGLRRLPARSPKLERFFDLAPREDAVDATDDTSNVKQVGPLDF